MATSTPTSTPAVAAPENPGAFRYILSFLLVGAAWGLTQPFLRRAAIQFSPRPLPPVSKFDVFGRISNLLRYAFDLLRCPAYFVPLALNLTGSVWFFLLIGKAELSLTVPIVNSLAFLFTVVGEWWIEGRKVDMRTAAGMGLVVGGIWMCVWSKGGKAGE